MNTAILALLRQRAADYLTDSCSIERATLTPDGLMGNSKSWSAVATDVSCRVTLIRRDSDAEAVRAGQASMIDEYLVSLPAGTDVRSDDRVTVGSETFEVVRLETSLTDAFFVKAVVMRLRGT